MRTSLTIVTFALPPVAPATPADAAPQWIGTWTTAPEPAAPSGTSHDGFTDQTVRMLVHTSVSGDRLRVRLSNQYGTAPLVVGHATVALPVAPFRPDVVPGSLRGLTFSSAFGATVPVGQELVSDSIVLPVPGELVLSLYLPTATGPTTWHWLSQQTAYVSGAGDHTADGTGVAFTSTETSWFFLTGLDVQTTRGAGTVIAFGDSLVEDNGSSVDSESRWPDVLAGRAASRIEVINEGIGGNRFLRDGWETDRPQCGARGLTRFDQNTFGRSSVRTVVILEGINDIQLDPPATVDQVVGALLKLARRSHAVGVRIVVSTLIPFAGSPFYDQTKDAVRQQVNQILRDSHGFDAVVDLDAVSQDPRRIRPEWDSGDHIHFNDAGYRALGEAIPLVALSGQGAHDDRHG
jgi:lysophospholipase L1-like esterase